MLLLLLINTIRTVVSSYAFAFQKIFCILKNCRIALLNDLSLDLNIVIQPRFYLNFTNNSFIQFVKVGNGNTCLRT